MPTDTTNLASIKACIMKFPPPFSWLYFALLLFMGCVTASVHLTTFVFNAGNRREYEKYCCALFYLW